MGDKFKRGESEGGRVYAGGEFCVGEFRVESFTLYKMGYKSKISIIDGAAVCWGGGLFFRRILY